MPWRRRHQQVWPRACGAPAPGGLKKVEQGVEQTKRGRWGRRLKNGSKCCPSGACGPGRIRLAMFPNFELCGPLLRISRISFRPPPRRPHEVAQQGWRPARVPDSRWLHREPSGRGDGGSDVPPRRTRACCSSQGGRRSRGPAPLRASSRSSA